MHCDCLQVVQAHNLDEKLRYNPKQIAKKVAGSRSYGIEKVKAHQDWHTLPAREGKSWAQGNCAADAAANEARKVLAAKMVLLMQGVEKYVLELQTLEEQPVEPIIDDPVTTTKKEPTEIPKVILR